MITITPKRLNEEGHAANSNEIGYYKLSLGYSAAEYSYIWENLYIWPKVGIQIKSNSNPKFGFGRIRGTNLIRLG